MENIFSSSFDNLKTSSRQILLPYQINSKTHCGISIKELEKILRQNIIQSHFDNITGWVLEEIFIMQKLDFTESSNTRNYKSTMTHIINTLKIICIKEISPRCIENIVELSPLINNYRSHFDFSKAILLMTSAAKSKVCCHLQFVACDSRSEIFQRYYNKVKQNNNLFDMNQITNNIFNAGSLAITDRIGDIELRQHSAFLLGQIYRRNLNLDPEEDILSKNAKNKIKGKMEKIECFKFVWDRLWAISNLIEDETRNLTKCVMFKKKFFEERNYFDNEFLCLISAVESIFATIRKVNLPLYYNSNNKEQLKFTNNQFDWIKVHTNESEKYYHDKLFNNNNDYNNINKDQFWTKQRWELQYKEIHNKIKINNSRKQQQKLLSSSKRRDNDNDTNHIYMQQQSTVSPSSFVFDVNKKKKII